MKYLKYILIIFIIVTSFFLYYTYFLNKKIIIGNEEYLSKITIIDLSNNDLTLDKDWMLKLKDFSNLKEVDLSNQKISIKQKEYLINNYPNIKFNLEVFYDVYNLNISENTSSLDLSNSFVDNDLINYLEYFPNLKDVNMGNNMLSLEQMANLTIKYPKINFKWIIKYKDKEISLDTEELDFKNDKSLIYDDIKNLFTILPALRKADFSNSNLSNEELGKLRELFPNIDIIWELHLGKWSLKTNDVAFSVLVGKINYVRLTTKDIEVLKYCTNLQALDLGHQAIDDISVIGDYLTDLRVLILADNKIKDITPLKNLKHLHYLELFVNKISDFSPLENLNELVDLNIGYNNVKDINQLLKFGNSVERFWLVNGGISEKERVILKNAYPNAKVNTAWSLSSTENGWRSHPRYYAMIDMFHKKNYISEEFSKYDKSDN